MMANLNDEEALLITPKKATGHSVILDIRIRAITEWIFIENIEIKLNQDLIFCDNQDSYSDDIITRRLPRKEREDKDG